MGCMGTEERPASEWPDDAERHFWIAALQGVAERERFERGVDDPVRVTVGYGALWGYYGRLRIRLAGQYAELRDETELFEEIDRWVAFQRPGGPGRRLDRDRAVMNAWRARLPEVRAIWESAAQRVFDDVAATTPIRWTWRIPVHEHETVFPDLPLGVAGIWASSRPAGWTPDQRTLALPQLWLEADNWAISLPEPDGETDAIVHVADKVQDEVMEELCTTWPTCRGHGHPLVIDLNGDVPRWVCRDDAGVFVEIDALSPDYAS